MHTNSITQKCHFLAPFSLGSPSIVAQLLFGQTDVCLLLSIGGIEICRSTGLLYLHVWRDKLKWPLKTDADTHFNASCKFSLCLTQSRLKYSSLERVSDNRDPAKYIFGFSCLFQGFVNWCAIQQVSCVFVFCLKRK